MGLSSSKQKASMKSTTTSTKPSASSSTSSISSSSTTKKSTTSTIKTTKTTSASSSGSATKQAPSSSKPSSSITKKSEPKEKSSKSKLTTPEEDLYSIPSATESGAFVSHIEHLAGPVLFTAPHGLQVYRGGEECKESERVHSKELYTNEICLILSSKMKKYLGIEGSFVIWNPKTAKPKDKTNLDPNYLLEKQFMSSPFHVFLHKLKKQYHGYPTLHVDIHGKINRKDNRNIDIGIAPMMALWKDKKLAEQVKKDFCDRMHKAVSTCTKKFSGFKLTIDRDPYLSGYWGDNTVTTISHQSILLDMPALQIELPMDIRKDLMTNDSLMEELAKAIAESYKTSVTSIFSKEWKEVEAKIDHVKTEHGSHEQIKHNSKTFDSMITQMLSEFDNIEKSQKTKKI